MAFGPSIAMLRAMTEQDRMRSGGSVGHQARLRLVVGALLIATVLSGCILGDPDVEPGLTVVNRTDETLRVYSATGSGDEAFHGEVPPHSTVETSVHCGSRVLLARRQDGTLVARRGPLDECNLEAWVITSR
jgi:hypothetical protein